MKYHFSSSLFLYPHFLLLFTVIKFACLVQFGRWDLKVHSAYRNVVVSWEAVARSNLHLWESNNALRKPSNGPRLQLSFTVFIQVFLPVVSVLFTFLDFCHFSYCYNILYYFRLFTYCFIINIQHIYIYFSRLLIKKKIIKKNRQKN